MSNIRFKGSRIPGLERWEREEVLRGIIRRTDPQKIMIGKDPFGSGKECANCERIIPGREERAIISVEGGLAFAISLHTKTERDGSCYSRVGGKPVSPPVSRSYTPLYSPPLSPEARKWQEVLEEERRQRMIRATSIIREDLIATKYIYSSGYPDCLKCANPVGSGGEMDATDGEYFRVHRVREGQLTLMGKLHFKCAADSNYVIPLSDLAQYVQKAGQRLR